MQLVPALTRDASAAAREQPAGRHLPYARHLDDHTIETRDGLLFQVIHGPLKSCGIPCKFPWSREFANGDEFAGDCLHRHTVNQLGELDFLAEIFGRNPHFSPQFETSESPDPRPNLN